MVTRLMQKKLIAFLRESAARPFAYGSDDCSLWLADWWRENHGVDPADWLRGAYATADEKDALLARHRGLQRLVSACAKRVGAERTHTPATGDFGLIVVEGRPYGAICTGSAGAGLFWAVRAIEPGVVFISNPRILRAWSIHVPMAEVASTSVGGAN